MNRKTAILLVPRVVALTLVLTFCTVVGFLAAGVSEPAATTPGPPEAAAPPSQAVELLALLGVCFLESVVLGYLVLRSGGSGRKLIGAVFLAFYGLGTVVAQIDSLIYLPGRLPQGMIGKIFLGGAITAGLFSPLAVLILGKMRAESPPAGGRRPGGAAGHWAGKLAALAALYVVVYYTFGYFVAWKSPVVRQYYGGTDPGSFFAQMAGIWTATPWMFAVQAFRGLLWVLFALPAIRMLMTPRWETALAAAMLFAVWSAMLLLPNPYMPEGIRMIHLVETATSNFLFGWLTGWLLSRKEAMSGGIV